MTSVKMLLTNIEQYLEKMHFINVINQEDKERVLIRSNLKTMSDISQWVEQFSLLSDTKWNMRTSKPVGERMVCKKMYECHHSSFNKMDRINSKRSESKNANCTASIRVKIKKKTYQTCRSDSYMKKDLWAIIVMTKEHTHSLGTPEVLKFLPSNQEETFIKYFENGLTAVQAYKYHYDHLLTQQYSQAELVNPRINPLKRSVYAWYHNWRSSKLKNVNADESSPVKDKYVKKKRKRGDILLIEEVKFSGVDDYILQEEIEIPSVDKSDEETELSRNVEDVEIFEMFISQDGHMTCAAVNNMCTEEVIEDDDCVATLPHRTYERLQKRKFTVSSANVSNEEPDIQEDIIINLRVEDCLSDISNSSG